MDRFQNGVDGLDEGGFFEGHVVRERDNATFGNPGHGFGVFGKTAAVGSEARGQTGGFVLLALREEAPLAIKTVAARNMMETHDAIAGLPFRDAATDRNDRASELVAKNLGRLNIAMEDFLDIGSAYAARRDLDEDFAFGNFGNGNFLDADHALLAVDPGAHGLGDGTNRAGGFQGWACAAHRATTSCSIEPLLGLAADTAGIYRSRKSASLTAACLLRLPNSMTAGICRGLRTTSTAILRRLIDPLELIVRLKSRGKLSSAVSLMERTRIVGIHFWLALFKTSKPSISTT